LTAVGDLRTPEPFVEVIRGVGISTEKLSLVGTGNGLTALAVAGAVEVAVAVAVVECGEPPVDEGDMLTRRLMRGVDGLGGRAGGGGKQRVRGYVSYGTPRDARTLRSDEILARSVVLVRGLWRRFRDESEASKPGRRVWSDSTADGADGGGSKTRARVILAMAMKTTLAMMAIIFQSFIILLKPQSGEEKTGLGPSVLCLEPN
jgi:hypothetical protein